VPSFFGTEIGDYRVPLHFAAIPGADIREACERFNLPLETWIRQQNAFGLLKKVYARRAKIRGERNFVPLFP
jgi:hypothetical protein